MWHPQFSTRTRVKKTGADLSLKEACEAAGKQMGSSLEALSGPGHWHLPRSGHKFLLGILWL